MDRLESLLRNGWAQLRAIERVSAEGGRGQEGKLPPPPSPLEKPKIEDIHSIERVHRVKADAFSKMNRLHGTLAFLASKEKRFEAGRQILACDLKVKECWRIIDHYRDTGELLAFSGEEPRAEFDPAEHDPAELIRLRNNARSYISKARKNGCTEEKIAEREEIISKIENYLKCSSK